MTTPPIVSITDELIAELESAANACGRMLLDSAETLTPAGAGVIECPVCYGEGYASLENDYCNFDNHAIGVQFYGIGSDFCAGERYFRAANPAVIRALLAERAELKRDAERYRALRHSLSGQKQCSNTEMPCISDPISPFITYTPDGLDAAIDAAMKS